MVTAQPLSSGLVRVTLGLIVLNVVAGCRGGAPAGAVRGQPAEVAAMWRYREVQGPAVGSRAMVVTDAALATRVGVDVLRAGGNAVDAAVAAAFALAVVYPEAGNIGGGGFLVLRTADGEVSALDFRETAPGAATRDMFLDENGEVTDRSITGHLASGVPGTVAGLWEAHERYGSLPWSAVVAPAIALAEDGFDVDARFEAAVRAQRNRLSRFPASAALYLPGGEPPAAGTRWRNPDLAATLRRIADQGAAGFYEGETADLLVAEMLSGGGLITYEDLRAYRPRWRDPIVFQYRGHAVVSMPPPSSGGVTLALMANILEGYYLARLGRGSPAALHLLTEAMRRAFADRNAYLGDPDFVEMPLERLLSRSHAAALRATIDLSRATPSGSIGASVGAPPEGNNTTHLVVADEAGNVVTLTTTINGLFGSAVTVSGAGFLLNNEMDDFTAKPGAPNMFGLVQGEANAIEPGKRMLSAMTPTLVMAPDGQPLLVTGARGGPRIITAVFQVLSNVIDHGADLATAVHLPRIHHQHLPDILYYEPGGLTPELVRALEAHGHTVEERIDMIGHAPAIMRVGDEWHGIADPRQGGLALGY